MIQYGIDGDCIDFFSCGNGDASGVVLGRWDVPGGARYMEVERMTIGSREVIGVPRYYDNRGNLLKIGNR